MRYEKNARVKFSIEGRVLTGRIVGRVMNGRKTVTVQVMDDQNKMWNLPSTKDIEKA